MVLSLLNSLVASTSRVCSRQSSRRPVQIFVQGPFCTQKLGDSYPFGVSCSLLSSCTDITKRTTVYHVKAELCRRRLISDPTEQRSYSITTSHHPVSLGDHIRLVDVGVSDLTTLHIWPLLLGGTRAGSSQGNKFSRTTSEGKLGFPVNV